MEVEFSKEASTRVIDCCACMKTIPVRQEARGTFQASITNELLLALSDYFPSYCLCTDMLGEEGAKKTIVHCVRNTMFPYIEAYTSNSSLSS
jgi:hypothetical protein